MSKRKNRKPVAKPAPSAAAPAKPAAPIPTPAPAKPATTSALVYLVPMVLVVLMGGALVFWLSRTPSPQPATPTNTTNANNAAASTALPQRRTNIGRTTGCQRNPTFAQSVGLGKQVVASTANGNYKGLLMFSAQNQNQPPYRHETWDDAGNLGQFVVDGAGNTYVTPAIEISVSPEALARQTTLYKVDTNNAVMAPFITLSGTVTANENPFGLMGLAYDCDTNTIYATSVAGSTLADEIGKIFRIDANTAQVTGQLENIDAMGIGVFNGAFGKRLYFGKARTPEVYSIALTDAGAFVGEPRFEFSLSEVPNGNTDQARRLQINDKRELTIRAWPFDFNLRAASETPKRAYKFQYNETTDQWDFISVEPITGVTAN
jgi:flagellar basal body-associated protein FliL